MSIALNGPRTSSGAFGFGSQVSIWLGPPTRNSMMQLTSLSLPLSGGGFVREEARQRQAERRQGSGVQEIAAT